MTPPLARTALVLASFVLAGAAACEASPREERESPIPRSCLIAGDAPQTIADVVERINALPRPVSLACFVASLPRPLSVVATTSNLSVQPATGPANPRLFILTQGVVMSIVPSGDGSHLLELSEWTSPTRTIKAELPFPVEAPLDHDAPYQILYDPGITTCGLCHRNEVPVLERPGAYVSDAMRPTLPHYAPLEQLYNELESCDFVGDAERCEMLSALLDFGPVEEVRFSDEIETFFN